MLGFLAGVPAKLATVIANVGTLLTRVAANVDVNVSTRAAASTAVSNADYTSARAAKLDFLTGVPMTSAIKSIQFVSTYINTTSHTFTITAVDLAKTIIVPTHGSEGGYGFVNGPSHMWSMGSPTQPQFNRSTDAGGTIMIAAYIVEFK